MRTARSQIFCRNRKWNFRNNSRRYSWEIADEFSVLSSGNPPVDFCSFFQELDSLLQEGYSKIFQNFVFWDSRIPSSILLKVAHRSSFRILNPAFGVKLRYQDCTVMLSIQTPCRLLLNVGDPCHSKSSPARYLWSKIEKNTSHLI